MSFKINPVKAVVQAHKDEKCGVHSMVNDCYSVCAAYKGVDNPWSVSPECASQCEMLTEKLRKGFYGLGYCDHHAPNRPVLWNQSPDFFPEQLKKRGDVRTALAISKKLCENTAYPLQCKKKAELQSYAVEQYSDLSSSSRNNDDSNDDDIDFRKYEDSHPVAFWIGFGVAGLFLIIFFVVLIKTLKK